MSQPRPQEERGSGTREVGDSGVLRDGTVIQEPENAYDIDDGVVFTAKFLIGPKGAPKAALDARKMVRDAVDDGSFKTDPEIKTNCVRVYYDDGPHVDIPVYRSTTDWYDNDKYELASVDWKESDPEGVNRWFREWIKAKAADQAPDREASRAAGQGGGGSRSPRPPELHPVGDAQGLEEGLLHGLL